MIIVLFMYLITLIVYFICFIRDIYRRNIIINDEKDLMIWLWGIAFWPIALIIFLITEKEEKGE